MIAAMETHNVPSNVAAFDKLVADLVVLCNCVRLSRSFYALRKIREAGGLLAEVQRSTGGRPDKNSSGDVTSYQFALKRAGISRQTANHWRHVADIDQP